MRSMRDAMGRAGRGVWARLALGLVSGAVAAIVAGCPSKGLPTYDPCTRTAECADLADSCTEIVFGDVTRSMCTQQGCGSDADCPVDARSEPGACLAFDGALSTCFEPCDANADCADGWGCEAVAPLGSAPVHVCVPTS